MGMEIIVAIARKGLFILLLLIAYFLFDRFELKGFKTREVLRNDPKAIALLLGLLAVAVALS